MALGIVKLLIFDDFVILFDFFDIVGSRELTGTEMGFCISGRSQSFNTPKVIALGKVHRKFLLF